MKDVERFTDEVNKDVQGKGIDYLILSAGGPPTGKWRMSPEVLNRQTGIDDRAWRKLLRYNV